ncbi:MAG: ABC transporter permease [Bacilli bacterium]|nr:ABC transporter permease [Bacilli bacterium]
MTVFKTFWQVVNKYKATVILYTVLLIGFGGLNMATNETGTTFVASKPDLFIVNEDKDDELSNNLVKYLEDNTTIKELDNDEEKINDAIFYRDVNYVVYIPKNYGKDLLNDKHPEIKIKSTGDYQASLAEMMLNRYLNIQNTFISSNKNVDDIIVNINETLNKKTNIEVTSKLDTHATTKATSYFNFASYSIMAAVIFIICLVLSSFHESGVNKRTIVSSMNYKKLNRNLLLSSLVYSFIVWVFYSVLGLIMVGDILFSIRGIVYMLNCLIFTFTSLTIALLISTLIKNKDAVSGIVNVIALGSAFLCGAFVPTKLLPDSVLTVAHALPSYWYINTNELLSSMEVINMSTLQPVITNFIVLLGFGMVFIIINNVATYYKRNIVKKI